MSLPTQPSRRERCPQCGADLSGRPDVSDNPEFVVGSTLLLLRNASFDDLTRATGMSPDRVRKGVAHYKENFGLQGNEKDGYQVSEDPEERLGMSRHLEHYYDPDSTG